METIEQQYYLGWLKDWPDMRDYHVKSEEVKPFLLRVGDDNPVLAPNYVIPKLPAIKNQGQLGSCTANAGAYMYETFEYMARGICPPPMARKFLYKVTRNLMRETGDTGGYLRTMMQGMATFGMPPEDRDPYDITTFDEEPNSFLYAMAQNYQALAYYRLDPEGKDKESVIQSMKINLSANRACVLGFVVFTNMGKGEVPLPGLFDSARGGHAIPIVGYDDNHKIGNSVGALKFANSWDVTWGYSGFGWLPYDYVRRSYATDIWTICSQEYLDTGVFN